MLEFRLCIDQIVCLQLLLYEKMHLMYYLNNEGKRIYTLKVSQGSNYRFDLVVKDLLLLSMSVFHFFLRSHVQE